MKLSLVYFRCTFVKSLPTFKRVKFYFQIQIKNTILCLVQTIMLWTRLVQNSVVTPRVWNSALCDQKPAPVDHYCRMLVLEHCTAYL